MFGDGRATGAAAPRSILMRGEEGGGGWKRGPGPVENMPSVVVRPSLTSTADTGVMSAL